MAVGDKAGAKGLPVYDNNLLVSDVDTALNQRGDENAASMTRLDKVEAAAIGTPKFAVSRSANGQNIKAETWTLLTGGAWGSAKNVGGFGWSGGVLTVPKAAWYEVSAKVMFRSNDYRTSAIQVTRNTSSLDTNASILQGETTVQSPDVGTNGNMSAQGTRKIALNAGDQIRVFVLQRNRGGNTVNIGKYDMDLTFDVTWFDSL